MPFPTAKKIKNLVFLGEEQKLSCAFLSFCSQKIICHSAKNLICEQGGEGKIGKGEVRVRMFHARQKKKLIFDPAVRDKSRIPAE